MVSLPPQRGHPQHRKDFKGEHQLVLWQGDATVKAARAGLGAGGGCLRVWEAAGCRQSRQEVTHPTRVPVPGVDLPDPGWYLLYFGLSRAPEGRDVCRELSPGRRRRNGESSKQGWLFFLFYGLLVLFFAWRVLEGDQWGGKTGEAQRGRCCYAVLGESGRLERAGASKMSWKWGCSQVWWGRASLRGCERLNPTL